MCNFLPPGGVRFEDRAVKRKQKKIVLPNTVRCKPERKQLLTLLVETQIISGLSDCKETKIYTALAQMEASCITALSSVC